MQKKFYLNIVKPEDANIDESWTVKDVAERRPPPSWESVFEDAKYELEDISEILENDKRVNGQWIPGPNKLFKAFEKTRLEDVKVVIVGQDPHTTIYRDGETQAEGLSFGVARNRALPPSLKNIYKEIHQSVEGWTVPKHGDLSRWCRQGVLMLNLCLTVRAKQPGCHKQLWLGFIKKVVNAILDNNPDCIFVMWGRKAQTLNDIIGERANTLETSHPSGYSANKGFLGSGHFNEINRILKETGQTQIDWDLDP